MKTFAVIIIGIFIGALYSSAPFDNLICTFTFRKMCSPVNITGLVESGWEDVHNAFAKQFHQGESRGAQLSLWFQGKLVVDLVGGAYEEPGYNSDSLVIVFSSTKAISPLVIALLVERGFLDYSVPIAKYWPEFGKNGKDQITVEDLMKHQAGLPGLDEPVPNSCLYATTSDCLKKRIEESSPRYAEGTTRGYHAVSRGWIENELVKLVDPQKRDLGTIFQEEFAKPLGAEFWIGHFPEDQHHRVVPLARWPLTHRVIRQMIPVLIGTAHPVHQRFFSELFNQSTVAHRSLMAVREITPDGDPTIFHTPEELKAVSPSSNGVTNSKSLGRILAMLANKGQLDGRRYLKEETIDLMLSNPTTQVDGVFGLNTTFTRGGFGLNFFDKAVPFIPGRWFGWMGWGGSVALFNVEHQAVYAYCPNGMSGSFLGDNRFASVFTALAKKFE